MNMVGRCHENGWGVPVDLSRRRELSSFGRGGHDWGRRISATCCLTAAGRARPVPGSALVSAGGIPGPRTSDESGRPGLEEGWGCGRSAEDAATGTTSRRGPATFAASTTTRCCSPSADSPRRRRIVPETGGWRQRADAPGHHFGACERGSPALHRVRARVLHSRRAAERIGTVRACAKKEQPDSGSSRTKSAKTPLSHRQGVLDRRWRDSRDRKVWTLESIGFCRRIHPDRSAPIASQYSVGEPS